MDPELLISTFPRLYHMADQDAWPSIQRHGMLSTSALLDLFEITGAIREHLEAEHRPESVPIHHPKYGRAVIRDQKPMSDEGLKRCLTGITPHEWYKLLNSKVFFWPTEDRLKTMRDALAYRHKPQCILVVNTRKLVEKHLDKIWLSPMNSGATKPMPHPRSAKTFLPLCEYPFAEWHQKRKQAQKAVAEVAVAHRVPDISEMVLEVSKWHEGAKIAELFSLSV